MAQHKVNYLSNGGAPIALTTVDKLVNFGRSNSLTVWHVVLLR